MENKKIPKLLKVFLKWLINTIVIALIVGLLSSYIWLNWINYIGIKNFVKNLIGELDYNIILIEQFKEKEQQSSEKRYLPLYKAQLKDNIYNYFWFEYEGNFSETTKITIENFYYGLHTYQENLDRLWLAGSQSNNVLGSQLFGTLHADQDKLLNVSKLAKSLLNDKLDKIKFCVFKYFCFKFKS